jgi:2-amino-4-hydroxy-6-hydroxymethyldihydropteridine diphosphokinase
MYMTEVVVGLGSNIGDSQQHILLAWEELGNEPDIILKGLSSPYYTEPVGMDSGNWFTNCVGLLETQMGPHELLYILLGIEKAFGRKRVPDGKKRLDRVIDLDLLFYGNQVIESPQLSVPHPEIQARLFVLAPLAELLPEKRHPLLGLTSSEMLACLLSHMPQDVAWQKEVRKTHWRVNNKDTCS